jgi:UDP-2-acetamido-2-deoxy-ribo-hexuluronate aminotransferase
MNPIQMVDLKSQYKKIKAEVDAAVINVLETAAFINGPGVKSFCEELASFTGSKYIIPCANGTDAIQVALMALDAKPGDEVIVPVWTYVATAEVIALLQLTPVFIEVDKDTFCLDSKLLEAKITPKTKAIVPVHLYGQCADMEAIMTIANKHNISVIEDTAQAIGAIYTFSDGTQKQAGTIGHIGTTSFFPSKNLGCYGDGGAIYTNDETLAKKMQMIAHHGERIKYYHDVVGINSRLDTVQAVILSIKLKHLKTYEAARNKVADTYDKAFASHPKIKTPIRAQNSTHVFHQYTLTLCGVERDGLREFLTEQNIPSMIYYPVPLHHQLAYKHHHNSADNFRITEDLAKCVISLPIHTEMEEDQQAFIIEKVLQYCI